MAGIGWQEIFVLGSLLAFCVLPIAAVAFAVLYFREKRRADGLEATLRQGGWQVLPPGAWSPAAGLPPNNPPTWSGSPPPPTTARPEPSADLTPPG